MRFLECLSVIPVALCLPIHAQIAEPISTKTAIPFAPGSGGLKLDYAGGIGESGGGSQIIPEATLEAGVGRGLETFTRFPLLRVTSASGSSFIAGGQLAVGARYLVASGTENAYALAVQTIVEAPTGNSRLENATQVMPGLLADWRPASPIVVHTNLMFDHSIGGAGPTLAFFEYSNAVVWLATAHFVPVLEFVGSTNTTTGRTQLIEQPEVILRTGPHFEFKAGLSFGLNSQTPHLGLRGQVDWFWGGRR